MWKGKNIFSFYINKLLVTSPAGNVNYDLEVETDVTLMFGYNGVTKFAGYMDEIRIYDFYVDTA
jgi:hypothetical protein